MIVDACNSTSTSRRLLCGSPISNSELSGGGRTTGTGTHRPIATGLLLLLLACFGSEYIVLIL